MPSKTDKIRIDDPFLDKRQKLLPCQKYMVRYWHDKGTSIRGLARMFGVDKRTIQFILFPDRLKKNKELRQDRGGSKIYYNRDKWRKQMRDHRQYKQEILTKATK